MEKGTNKNPSIYGNIQKAQWEPDEVIPLVKKEEEPPAWDFWVVLNVVLLLVLSVFSNMGASMMSYVMPAYPVWLLYMSTLGYTIGFFICAIMKGEKPFARSVFTWPVMKHILLLSFLTSGTGLAFQFSAAWVDGDLAQVLANLLLPEIALLRYFLIPRKKTPRPPGFHWNTRTIRKTALVIVVLGIVMGSFPSLVRLVAGHAGEGSNLWYMVVLAILSTFFSSLQQVALDFAYHDREAVIPDITLLAWYNLFSIPFYLITIPLEAVPYLNGTYKSTTIRNAFLNQVEAAECFLLHPSAQNKANNNCWVTGHVFWASYGPVLWPIVYLLGYLGSYCSYAYLIRRKGVLFPNMLAAFVQLLVSVIFMIPALVSPDFAVPFSLWPIFGCSVILAGVFMRGKPHEVPDQHPAE